MNNLFSIGEVSKIKEITIKALRYYHKMGILIPKYTDETTGYRYYSIDQFVYMDIIKGCRALGTSISELQEIFKACDTDKLLEFLELKKQEAEESINKMKEVINTIDQVNRNVAYSRKLLNQQELEIQFFNERYIIVVPCGEVVDLKELLYYAELDKMIEERNVKVSTERGILYNFNKEGNVIVRYAFNTLDDRVNLEMDQYIKILPEGNYLTLTYTRENQGQRIAEMMDYIKEKKLEIIQFVEVELYKDFFNSKDYGCQIQVFTKEMYRSLR